MQFSHHRFEAPKGDFDLTIVFPNGKELLIQARPSNADVDYLGSLDIIFPDNQAITCWEGDNMKPAKGVRGAPEGRIAKQIVTELPPS